MKGLDYCE